MTVTPAAVLGIYATGKDMWSVLKNLLSFYIVLVTSVIYKTNV